HPPRHHRQVRRLAAGNRHRLRSRGGSPPLPRHAGGRGRHPQGHAHRGRATVLRGGGAPACLRNGGERGWRPGRDAVDHIFRRPRKPKAVLLSASIVLFLMALGCVVEAALGEPLTVGEAVVAAGLEATSYRIGAALLLALLGGWLFARSLPPKSEADRLTG